MKRSTSLKFFDVLKIILICIFTLSIPLMLYFYAEKSKQYTDLRKDILQMEQDQKKLIEENKKLVSEISILSNPERIEKIAVEELGMHKAESDDILRVEMAGGSKNE